MSNSTELNHRVYVVEVPGKDSSTWVSVHTTDDAKEAVRVAKEEAHTRKTNARVRQFWVAKAIPQRDTIHHAGSPTPEEGDLTEYTCMNHRFNIVRAFAGPRKPTCPDCHKDMVTTSLAEAVDAGPVADWSGGTKT